MFQKQKQRGVFENPKGSGCWWVRIPLGGGKYRREKVGAYSEAVRRFRQHSERERCRTGPTVEEAFDRFFALRAKVDPAYVVAARNFLKEFPATTSLHEFAQVSVIREWRARRERVRKAGTVNREMAFLSGVFKQAIEDQHLDENVIGRQVRYCKRPTGRTRWLFPHEEEILRRELSEEDWEAAEFIRNTGLRRKEQWRLRWEDVADGNLHVDVSKNGKPRDIPLNAIAQEILDRRRARGLERPFPGRRVCSFARRFNEIVRELGLVGVTLHVLRHDFATNLARQGVPVRTIMVLMGHSCITMTQRYLHVADQDLQKAVDGLCSGRRAKVPCRRRAA